MWWIFYSEWHREHVQKLDPRYKIVIFIHDEFGLEVKEEYLEEVRKDLEGYMINGAKTMMPDMRIEVESTAMRRWSKEAQGVFDSEGKIVVYEDALASGLIEIKDGEGNTVDFETALEKGLINIFTASDVGRKERA